MTLDQLDSIITLAAFQRHFQVQLWIMPDGKCRDCGINTRPPPGAPPTSVRDWSYQHAETCQVTLAARVESWALHEREKLFGISAS